MTDLDRVICFVHSKGASSKAECTSLEEYLLVKYVDTLACAFDKICFISIYNNVGNG